MKAEKAWKSQKTEARLNALFYPPSLHHCNSDLGFFPPLRIHAVSDSIPHACNRERYMHRVPYDSLRKLSCRQRFPFEWFCSVKWLKGNGSLSPTFQGLAHSSERAAVDSRQRGWRKPGAAVARAPFSDVLPVAQQRVNEVHVLERWVMFAVYKNRGIQLYPGCESLSIKDPGLLGSQREVYKRPDHTHGFPNWRLSSAGVANPQGKLQCKGEWAPRRQLQPASLVLIPWVQAKAVGLPAVVRKVWALPECVYQVTSVVSDVVQTKDCSPPGSSVHGDSPGKSTGVGCRALLQGIFLM